MVADKAKSDSIWAMVIGFGLAFLPIHNKWLTDLATNSKGETMFFLPSFGYLLLLMGIGLFLLNNWERVKQAGWGDKKVLIPLAVICIGIGLSGITANGMTAKFAPLGMGVFLLGLYFVARILGKQIFLPVAVGVGIASLGIITYAVWNPSVVSGGFVFEKNYAIATSYILLGLAMFRYRYWWALGGLSVIALFLSGSPYAVYALCVVGLVAVIRRDWTKRAVAILGCACILIGSSFYSGYGERLYTYTWHIIQTATVGANHIDSCYVFSNRWDDIKSALTNLKPLGEGYNLTAFTTKTVHNVPLVIVQQLGWFGILASMAWLWVSVWCLIKTKWKYAWTLILALSVFDHSVWTQLAPWWWALAGVSCREGER